jgi:hypothetical protein
MGAATGRRRFRTRSSSILGCGIGDADTVLTPLRVSRTEDAVRELRRDAELMPSAAYPLPPHDPALDRVAEVLDPILTPMRFAAGQLGSSGPEAQVIYCRGSCSDRYGLAGATT